MASERRSPCRYGASERMLSYEPRPSYKNEFPKFVFEDENLPTRLLHRPPHPLVRTNALTPEQIELFERRNQVTGGNLPVHRLHRPHNPPVRTNALTPEQIELFERRNRETVENLPGSPLQPNEETDDVETVVEETQI